MKKGMRTMEEIKRDVIAASKKVLKAVSAHEVPKERDEKAMSGFTLQRQEIGGEEFYAVARDNKVIAFLKKPDKAGRVAAYEPREMLDYKNALAALARNDYLEAEDLAMRIGNGTLRKKVETGIEHVRYELRMEYDLDKEPEPITTPFDEPHEEPKEMHKDGVTFKPLSHGGGVTCFEVCVNEPKPEPEPEPERPMSAIEKVTAWCVEDHEGVYVDAKPKGCIWVSGNTKPVKDELKGLGFRWSGKRRAWWYDPRKAA